MFLSVFHTTVSLMPKTVILNVVCESLRLSVDTQGQNNFHNYSKKVFVLFTGLTSALVMRKL